MFERRYFGFVLLAPSLVIIGVVTVVPLLYTVANAFFYWNLAQSATDRNFVGLSNFVQAINDPVFWLSLKNTAIYALGTIGGELLIGLGLALMLNRPFWGRYVVRSIIMIPLFLVPVVTALLWRMLYQPEAGIIPFVFRALHLATKQSLWLGDAKLGLPLTIAVSVWQVMPFAFLVLVAGLQGIPRDQYEAAEVDGSSRFQTFWHITLPWLKPLILLILLMRVMDAFRGSFDLIYILTGGGPGYATEVTSLYIFQNGLVFFNIGYASAMAVMVVALVFALSIVLINLLRMEKHI